MNGYDYGNARIRALRSRMLTVDDYSGLLNAGTIERLLGSLADTAYAPEVQAALLRFSGLRCLDEAVRSHLARHLRMLTTFFDGPERSRLERLLHGWDLRNLRTILRGRVRIEGSEQIVRLLVAAGTIDEPALIELASQPSLRATVELMMAWNLPSAGTAARMITAWPEYEATNDPSVIEGTLNRAYADHLRSSLSGGPSDEITRILRLEIDQINLVSALRLRSSRLAAEPGWDTVDPSTHFLPAGRIPVDSLESVRLAETPSDVARLLQDAPLPPTWTTAVTEWSVNDDLLRFSASLEAAMAREAVGLFAKGDPLGIAIPVAFAWTKESEARNLRLIGRGVVHAIPPEVVEQELIAS